MRARVFRLVWLIGPSISQDQLLTRDESSKARGVDVVWWVDNRFLSMPGDAFGFGEDFLHQLFVRAWVQVDSATTDHAGDFAVCIVCVFATVHDEGDGGGAGEFNVAVA